MSDIFDLNQLRERPDEPAHQHMGFQPDVQVQVFRDQEKRDGEDIGFIASIGMSCADCGEPFWWPGLRRGQSFTEPRVTPDSQRLLAPFRPLSAGDMPVDKIPDIDGDADAATQRTDAVKRALQHPAQYAIRTQLEDAVTWRARAITNALDSL